MDATYRRNAVRLRLAEGKDKRSVDYTERGFLKVGVWTFATNAIQRHA